MARLSSPTPRIVRGRVFVDTGAIIGRLNPDDAHRTSVLAAWSQIDDEVMVTSDLVLVEALNHTAGRSRSLRQAMQAFVGAIMGSSSWKVTPFGRLGFTDALKRYGSPGVGRALQPSLVDAHIHDLMISQGIHRILTVDAYFEHMGMTNLVDLHRR